MRSLEEVNLVDKRVLLRLDTNVPLTGNPPRLTDDFRLRAALPTINFLLNHKAKIILLGHLGRPKGSADPELSLRPVYRHLSALLNKSINFAPRLFASATKKAIGQLEAGQLLGLENLRFDPGEDKNSRTFARKLSQYGDLLVDDAFGLCHRASASTVVLTEFLPSYPGLLLEHEYKVLTSLLRHPARPFVVVIGGAKIDDKLPVIRHLQSKADRILVGGGVANTFLAARGEPVGQSLVDTDQLVTAKKLLDQARGRIILPVDLSWDDDRIFDIGPKTVQNFSQYLEGAKTIFWNGNLGKTELPLFAKGSVAIAQLMAKSKATTIVGGGNTIEILTQHNLLKKMSFVSTGGGATLDLLAGSVLPGVRALE